MRAKMNPHTMCSYIALSAVPLGVFFVDPSRSTGSHVKNNKGDAFTGKVKQSIRGSKNIRKPSCLRFSGSLENAQRQMF
uniref:Putative ovule protein n=1 Tax=Solanum chacoense TaxID=4108 RepID=A0A0V0HZA4_SOLCH